MIKVSLIGCDSTHVHAFGKLINNQNAPLGTLASIHSIWDADMQKSSKAAQALGDIQPSSSLADAIEQADAIMILNRFGEDRFDLVMQATEARIPVFVDKPLTMNLHEAEQLVETYNQLQIPLFSTSVFRFSREVQDLKTELEQTEWLGGSVIGPASCKDLGNDPRLNKLHFYGIHLAEMLQEVFGSGVRSVQTLKSDKGFHSWVQKTDGSQIGLLMLDPMDDYYSVEVYTSSGVRSVTLDLEGDFYIDSMMAFLEFVNGDNGISPKETLEALELMFAIEQSALIGERVFLRNVCDLH